MKRLLYITVRDDNNISGFTVIHPKDIGDVVNYSIDHIYTDCLEFLPEDIANNLITTISHKIRPGGIMTIVVSNTKQICRNYCLNILNDNDYIKLNANHRCVLSLDTITDFIQKLENIKILKVEYSTNQLEMAIASQRVSV